MILVKENRYIETLWCAADNWRRHDISVCGCYRLRKQWAQHVHYLSSLNRRWNCHEISSVSYHVC